MQLGDLDVRPEEVVAFTTRENASTDGTVTVMLSMRGGAEIYAHNVTEEQVLVLRAVLEGVIMRSHIERRQREILDAIDRMYRDAPPAGVCLEQSASRIIGPGMRQSYICRLPVGHAGPHDWGSGAEAPREQ